MLVINSLSDLNFDDFNQLLLQRGEVHNAFYQWKYLEQPPTGLPTGLIAYFDGKPVGCIGIINRTIIFDGIESTATWFADWFVSEGARGHGVGLLLMQRVKAIAGYGFGVPGPERAQVICSKAGYKKVPGFFEAIIYLRPFNCGYKRFGGNPFKKAYRGFRNEIKFGQWFAKRIGKKVEIHKKKPDAKRWHSVVSNQNNTRLARSLEFLEWVLRIPAEEKGPVWWFVDMPGLFVVGFYEEDFWGLRRAKILEMFSENMEFEEQLSYLTYALKKEKVDLLNLVVENNNYSFVEQYKPLPIPLFFSGDSIGVNLCISNLDKESAWYDFKFAL